MKKAEEQSQERTGSQENNNIDKDKQIEASLKVEKLEEEKTAEITVTINKQDVDMLDDDEMAHPANQPQDQDEYIPQTAKDRSYQQADNVSHASRTSRQSKGSRNRSTSAHNQQPKQQQGADDMLNIPGFALMDDQMFSGPPSNSNKPSKKAKRDRSKTTKSKVSDKPESFARNAPSSMASRSGQNPIGGASSMTPDERIMAALTQDQEVTMKANQKLSTSRRAKQSGESILNQIVELIVEECIKRDTHLIFRYDVDKKIAPGYYNIITKPICLERMKAKARR